MGNDTENIKILCIGVGGAGTNVINRMEDIAMTIAIPKFLIIIL